MIYRGSVVEVRKDYLIVMLENSTFERVEKFEGLEEGMEIYFEKENIIKKSNLGIKNISLVAAAVFLFIVTSFYGINVWDTNYRVAALVSVDINPSVEIKINKSHKVIKAVALNKDAEQLPLKDLKNQPISKALEILVRMANEEGYIKEAEENYILVASVELRKGAVDEEGLKDLIEEGKHRIENSAKDAGQQVEVVALESNRETLQEARKEHVSVGKLELYQNTKTKQDNSLKEKINKDKEELDKHLKQLEKEAKQLEQKLKDLQKMNNNGNKRYNDVMKEEQKKLEEEIKQEKDKLKQKTSKDEKLMDKNLEKLIKEAQELEQKLIDHKKSNNNNKDIKTKEQNKNKVEDKNQNDKNKKNEKANKENDKKNKENGNQKKDNSPSNNNKGKK